MGVLTLWSRSPIIEYRASTCSKGSVFLVVCTFLTLVLPFLVGYRSDGFWLKESTYLEQPEIHFKHEVMVVLQSSESQKQLVWSTYPIWNDAMETHFRDPIISSFEEDLNNDGKNDRLVLDIEFPLLEREAIVGVQLLLGFDVKMYSQLKMHMNGLAFITCSPGSPGGELTVIGDLNLHQRKPLPHKGLDNRFKDELIPLDSVDLDDYSFTRILENYSHRNLTTRLGNDFHVWMPAGEGQSSFQLRVRLHYPLQTVLYTPGVWQVLKMAWIQYLSLLVIFAVVASIVKQYVFVNQLIPTWTTYGDEMDRKVL